MVLREALDMMLEGVQRAGRRDACLTHAAAKQLAYAARLHDQLARPGECRANRRSQALAEADGDRIEVPGPLPGGDVGGDNGVPQARAVEVQGEVVLAGPAAD